MKTTLYRRNAAGVPLFWEIEYIGLSDVLKVKHGIVDGTKIIEYVPVTKKNEFQSRVNAKKKEGYKELTDIKDSNTSPVEGNLYNFLNTYLPKYSTNSEGFVLPMLAKLLEDNKPFEKSIYTGQWKINGLRCLIGAEKSNDMFNPIKLTYTSREGTKWNLSWMDEIILPKLHDYLKDLMVDLGAYLDGELYLPGYSVNEINHLVKNPTDPNHKKLQYWCYDLALEDSCFLDRYSIIKATNRVYNIPIDSNLMKSYHLNNKEQFLILPCYKIDDITDATAKRDAFIAGGFEGLIVRNIKANYQFGKRNSAMFKYKKIDDGLFVVVDIEEDKRGLPVYTLRNDINNELFQCTINLSHDAQIQQLAMKKFLIGKQALVEFRERSGVKQVPFHAKIIKIYV